MTSQAAREGRLVVLHALAPAAAGGLERVVQGLATGHEGRGHEVHVAAVLDSPATGYPFIISLREAGVRVHTVELSGRAYAMERSFIRDLCREARPNVFHSHGYRADVIDAGAARRWGLPVVTTVHGFTRGGWKNRLYEHIQRRTFRRFDAVVAVSRVQVRELEASGVPSDRIHHIPNAWIPTAGCFEPGKARAALGVPREGIRIGWIGRLSPEKGADVFLKALARAGRADLLASIVGEGSDRGELEAQAWALGVGERVTWHGLVPDAGRLMKAFDLLVLSSRTEGIPIVLFEAMAAGVPVVATRVGGVPEVLSDREALLVAPDDPEALASAVEQAIAHPDATGRRRDAARARLDTAFRYPPWLARYEELYRALVPRDAGAPRAVAVRATDRSGERSRTW